MKLRFASIVFLAAFAAGCHEEPSPTGIGFLPNADLVGLNNFDTQIAQSPVRSSSYFAPTPAATSQYLTLGKTADYNSRILIRWLTLPSDVAGGGAIVSATVTLHRAPYAIGDSAAPFAFDAFEVRKPWSSFTFTSDSLASLQLGPAPAGSFSATAKDSVTFTVDTTLVRSWLQLMNQQRYTENYGLLLLASQGTNALLAFQSAETPSPPTFSIRMTIDGKDTTFQTASLEDTFIAKGPALPATSLAVHGGLSYRGKVWFDVSSVPSGSIVNRAILTLTVDQASSRKSYRGVDSLLVFELKDSTTNTLGTSIVYTSKADTANRIIAQGLGLTQMTQRWVNHSQDNHGLVLAKLYESSDLDLIGLFGADADPALRPKLVILYTKKP